MLQPLHLARIYELTRWLDNLLRQEPVGCGFPSSLPTSGGVYIIFDKSHGAEQPVYVGLTGNLRDRLSKHLHGGERSGSIKTAIVHFGRARSFEEAKRYLSQHCIVRYDVVPDYREREMREGFAKAVLKPEFSLYKSKEH